MIIGDKQTVYADIFQSGGLWHFNIHRRGEPAAVYASRFIDGHQTQAAAVAHAANLLPSFGGAKPLPPLEVAVNGTMVQVDPATLGDHQGLDRLSHLDAAVEALIAPDEVRKVFLGSARMATTLYLATLTTGIGATFLYQVNLAGAILILVQTIMVLAIIAILETTAKIYPPEAK